MLVSNKPNITEYQHRYVRHEKWRDAQRQKVLPLCPQILPSRSTTRLHPFGASAYQEFYNPVAQAVLQRKRLGGNETKRKKLSPTALNKQRAHQYARRQPFATSTTYNSAFVLPPKGFRPEKTCRPRVKPGGPIASIDHLTSTPQKSSTNETFHEYNRLEIADIAANVKLAKKPKKQNTPGRLPLSVPLSKHSMYMLEYPWKVRDQVETLYLRQQSRKNKSGAKLAIIGREAENEEARQRDRQAQFDTTARTSFGGGSAKPGDRLKRFGRDDNLKIVTHDPGKYYLNRFKIVHKHPEATFDDARQSVTLTKT